MSGVVLHSASSYRAGNYSAHRWRGWDCIWVTIAVYSWPIKVTADAEKPGLLKLSSTILRIPVQTSEAAAHQPPRLIVLWTHGKQPKRQSLYLEPILQRRKMLVPGGTSWKRQLTKCNRARQVTSSYFSMELHTVFSHPAAYVLFHLATPSVQRHYNEY